MVLEKALPMGRKPKDIVSAQYSGYEVGWNGSLELWYEILYKKRPARG